MALGELGFQLVAQVHELIDFGDDAVLFGEGRYSRSYLNFHVEPNQKDLW